MSATQVSCHCPMAPEQWDRASEENKDKTPDPAIVLQLSRCREQDVYNERRLKDAVHLCIFFLDIGMRSAYLVMEVGRRIPCSIMCAKGAILAAMAEYDVRRRVDFESFCSSRGRLTRDHRRTYNIRHFMGFLKSRACLGHFPRISYIMQPKYCCMSSLQNSRWPLLFPHTSRSCPRHPYQHRVRNIFPRLGLWWPRRTALCFPLHRRLGLVWPHIWLESCRTYIFECTRQDLYRQVFPISEADIRYRFDRLSLKVE
ncbi:hypothetical protein B0H34DRAFT_79129 [Crassisporium funariophilum]|nr:hypothetical protein B0H34DRAFT_79129 [Crassisporium funariophilum]